MSCVAWVAAAGGSCVRVVGVICAADSEDGVVYDGYVL